jgi:hypothetical protein
VWAGRIIIQEKVIPHRVNGGLFKLFSADLDSDGDLDIIVPRSFVGDNIDWFENDGRTRHPRFTHHTILTPPFSTSSIGAVDMDGDGDMDLVGAFPIANSVAWLENDGGSPPQFTVRVLDGQALGAILIVGADLDGDGDTDVVSANGMEPSIVWYENDGLSPPSVVRHVIKAPAYAGPTDVGDLDGDGDPDIIAIEAGNPDQLVWYENDGSSPPGFQEHAIASKDLLLTSSTSAADVDGDGDLDIVSGSHNLDQVIWYENVGGSTLAFLEHIITEDPDGRPGPPDGFANGPLGIAAADLDDDGDLDLASGSSIDGKIAWYENKGGSPIIFRPRTLVTDAGFVTDLLIGDIESDGDPDLIYPTGALKSLVGWLENIVALPDGHGERPEGADQP